MIVAVVNVKGGTGKTTTAMHLARLLSAWLFDADRQGSALRWALAAGEMLGVRVVAAATTQIAAVIEGTTALEVDDRPADAVIDCGPGDADIMAMAMALADVVVVPTNPREDDVGQAKIVLRQAETMGVPAVALFSRVRRSEGSTSLFRGVLRAEGFDALETVVPELVEIGFRFGEPIETTAPFDDVLEELAGVVAG